MNLELYDKLFELRETFTTKEKAVAASLMQYLYLNKDTLSDVFSITGEFETDTVLSVLEKIDFFKKEGRNRLEYKAVNLRGTSIMKENK